MAKDINVLRVCEVISVDDPTGQDRIKVRLVPEDVRTESTSDLAYVFPLMPKHFFVKPKVGETVLVITAAANDGNSQRYYIGPVVPQMNSMEDNEFGDKGTTYLGGSRVSPGPSPYLDKNASGIFPDENDVSVIGKRNTDIQMKDNDIRIRCGMGIKNNETPSGLMFNRKDPAYIKLKYNPETNNSDYNSSINIVADKINLLGNNSKEYFNTTDKKDLVTEEEMKRILAEGHPLIYGDKLVQFLKELVDAIVEHVHQFPGMKPCYERTKLQAVKEYDLDKILSDTIRIN